MKSEEEEHKFAKELEECSGKGIEISQECKKYYRKKFNGERQWQEKTTHSGTFKR